MSLANLVVPEDHHRVGDEVIRITGLDMESIVVLLQENKPIMEAMMDTELTTDKLIRIAPDFVAKMIAFSAGEPNEWEKVKRIPFGDQIQMVNKIWTLTHIDMEQVGNVMGLLADTLDKLAGASPGNGKG